MVFNDVLVSRKETKLTGIKEGDFLHQLSMQNKKTTTRQEDFRINFIFRLDFLVNLGLLRGGKFDSSIYRILILGFYYFFLSIWFIITYLDQL